jgi:hypothetical protein
MRLSSLFTLLLENEYLEAFGENILDSLLTSIELLIVTGDATLTIGGDSTEVVTGVAALIIGDLRAGVPICFVGFVNTELTIGTLISVGRGGVSVDFSKGGVLNPLVIGEFKQEGELIRIGEFK